MSHSNSINDTPVDADEYGGHEQYLNALHKITSDSTLSFEAKVRQLLELGCDYFDVDVGMLTHEQKDSFEIEIMRGSHPELGEGTLTPPMTDNYCRRVVSDGETICVQDAGASGWQDDALYHQFGLECYAGVEVTAGNDRYGTICFTDLSPREQQFTESERTFIEFLGQSVSYELERKQRVDHLTALNTLSRELMDVGTADAVSQHVVETAEKTLDLPVTAVALHDYQTDELETVAQTARAEAVLRATSLLADGGPGWNAFTSGTRETVDLSDRTDIPLHPPVTEAVIFPLGEHGVFLTGSTRTDGFAPSEVNFVETVVMNTNAALDRAEREQQLQRQNDRLESFSSMLAHELRNPLMIAQIYHQQAADGDEAAAEEVDTALSRIEEMIDVLLVTASGDESGIDWESVALPNVITDAWTDVPAESAELVLETNRTVLADQIQLQHLFKNLFDNSIEHGSENVTIRVGDLEDGFYVEDNGLGIPPEERDEVFEVGYTTNEDGMGLGLTFVAQLAETYGWECTVTESEEEGARFEFTAVGEE
jgi:signal transduction histidine kinase